MMNPTQNKAMMISKETGKSRRPSKIRDRARMLFRTHRRLMKIKKLLFKRSIALFSKTCSQKSLKNEYQTLIKSVVTYTLLIYSTATHS